MREKFWRNYTLEELTPEEWEALCDGCALCCLHKLEDADTGHVAVTDVVCRYLDMENCSCTDYENRHKVVPDCVPFNAETAKSFFWLPDTCAYRLRAHNKPLYDWHYLESGDRDLVHQALVSVKHQGISETVVHPDEWQERVIRWVDSPLG